MITKGLAGEGMLTQGLGDNMNTTSPSEDVKITFIDLTYIEWVDKT